LHKTQAAYLRQMGNYPPEASASYEQGKKIGAAISKLTGKSKSL
jgi:hypothetical protein